MKREEVVTEVERYFVYPGQACSYMVGCQSILSLREKARTALADKFDLRQFHAGKNKQFFQTSDVSISHLLAVLLHGSLPLNILENIIDEFIRSNQLYQS